MSYIQVITLIFQSKMSYWANTGKFQKVYDYFWNKLVPSQGRADSPEGELLRNMSKIYYRYYNDGDTYEHVIEEGMANSITSIKGIDTTIAYKIENKLWGGYELSLEEAVNISLKYIMLKNSTKEKIWNPDTNRLVKVASVKGLRCQELLDCPVNYEKNY